MKTRFIWKESWINNDKDSFWIECTNDEVIDKILPFKTDEVFIKEINVNRGPSKINPNRNEDIYCNFFLVSTDLMEIKSFEWVYPYSGMWNSSNPFIKIEVIDLINLDELDVLFKKINNKK
jgi:hypothetical protein